MECELAGQENYTGLDKIQTENDTDLLFLLPPEIVEKVFDYLDAPALLNLRLTSKTKKAFVEHGKLLQKIPVYMKPEKICSVLKQVNASSIPWTNFKFDMGLMTTIAFPKFASIYASNIKVCCLYGKADQYDQRIFLFKLTSLRTLEIRNSAPLPWHFYGRPGPPNIRQDKTVIENLGRVRTLRLRFDFDTHIVDLKFLMYLKHSSNLRILVLKQDSQIQDRRYLSIVMNESLFQPLFQFLKSRRHPDDEGSESHPLNFTPLDIYFQGIERVKSTGNKFRECGQTFLKILKECHRSNVKLHNVPSYVLPADTSELKDVIKLDSCIVSLAKFRQRGSI